MLQQCCGYSYLSCLEEHSNQAARTVWSCCTVLVVFWRLQTQLGSHPLAYGGWSNDISSSNAWGWRSWPKSKYLRVPFPKGFSLNNTSKVLKSGSDARLLGCGPSCVPKRQKIRGMILYRKNSLLMNFIMLNHRIQHHNDPNQWHDQNERSYYQIPSPRERGEDSNIQTLILTVIIDVVAIVIAIIVLMIVEFYRGS